MDDYQRDHTSKELLDRIIRLERDNERLQEHLRAHKTLIANLQKEFDREADDLTLNLKKIHRHLNDIYQNLWPVVYKTFPNLARQRVKNANIVGTLLEASQVPIKK